MRDASHVGLPRGRSVLLALVRPLFLALAVLLAAGAPVRAQHAATLPPLDDAYLDLDRVAAFGLLPRGHAGLAPYSRGRVAWLTQEARTALAARGDLGAEARADLTVLLDRLEARFGDGAATDLAAQGEVEVGGGASPGTAIPHNLLGGVDAVLNPLWAGRGGRMHPDRAEAAVAGRVDVPLGRSLALSAAYRAVEGTWSPGERSERPQAGFEALGVRLVTGRWAFQAGRDAVWMRPGGHDGALLGANGPALNLLRVATDRPVAVPALGALDVSFFVADMGPRDHFPHAKLFGALFAAQPTSRLDLTLALLNKQLGEGAPEASLAERLKDLTWAWDWFRSDEGQFSDKSLALSVAHRGDVVALFGEVTLNDVDLARPNHTFRGAAAYRVGLTLPRLGVGGRHRLGAEAVVAGPMISIHHHFLGGAAVDGFLQGALPGPESRRVHVEYGYQAPRAAWRGTLRVTAEARSGDQWLHSLFDIDELVRVLAVPDERRVRSEGALRRPLAGGRGGLELRVGAERVWNFGHTEGVRRWNGAALARLSWGF